MSAARRNLLLSRRPAIFSRACFGGEAGVGPGIDQAPVFGEGLAHPIGAQRRTLQGLDDDLHRQTIFLGEFVIALVVRGNAHDRARSVFRENEIRDPDGNELARERIHGEAAGEESFLFGRGNVRGARAFGAASSSAAPPWRRRPGHLRSNLRELRMAGGNQQGRNAVNRVDARGENFEAQAVNFRDIETDARALAICRSSSAAGSARARASRLRVRRSHRAAHRHIA